MLKVKPVLKREQDVGWLGTAADLCMPPSAPSMGHRGGQGPGKGGTPWAGALAVRPVGAEGTSQGQQGPFGMRAGARLHPVCGL